MVHRMSILVRVARWDERWGLSWRLALLLSFAVVWAWPVGSLLEELVAGGSPLVRFLVCSLGWSIGGAGVGWAFGYLDGRHLEPRLRSARAFYWSKKLLGQPDPAMMQRGASAVLHVLSASSSGAGELEESESPVSIVDGDAGDEYTITELRVGELHNVPPENS